MEKETEKQEHTESKEINFTIPSEYNPELDILGSFSGIESDEESDDFDKLFCETCDKRVFLDPSRAALLKKRNCVFGYFIFPRRRVIHLLTSFYASLTVRRQVGCFFQLPQYPNRVYFEVEEYSFISTYHPLIKIIKVPFDDMVRELSQTWIGNIKKGNFSEFGRINVSPYKDDPCQIMDIDIKKKLAIVRIVPRIELPDLGYSVGSPKLFDEELFKQKNIELEEKEKKILFSGNTKVMCCGFHDMWFAGGCLLTQVKVQYIDFSAKVDDAEKEMFSNKMKLTEDYNPDDDIDWEDPDYPKIIKNIRDRNDTEHKRERVTFKKVPAREQMAITNEEKVQLIKELRAEQEARTARFETFVKKPPAVVKLPVKMEMKTVELYNEAPEEITADELTIDMLPKSVVEEVSRLKLHSVGLLVELPSGIPGVVTHKEEKETTILLYDGHTRVIPITTELVKLNDDGTSEDVEGERVLRGDKVVVTEGEYEGYTGVVCHTYNNRVFGTFSNQLGIEKKILCFPSNSIRLVDVNSDDSDDSE